MAIQDGEDLMRMNHSAEEIDAAVESINEIQEHLELHDEELDNKLGRSETAAAAVLDGAGGNIAGQFTAVETKFARGIQSLATLSTTVAANGDRYLKITMDNGRSEFLVIAQSTINNFYYTYLVRNYGDGTSLRCRITQLNGGISCQKYIDGNTLYIKFGSNASTNGWSIKTHILQGNSPALEISDTYSGEVINNTLPAELESRLAALESAVATTAE